MISKKIFPFAIAAVVYGLMFTSYSCSVEKKTKSNGDSLLVSIQRYPCFGRCPYYDASLYESGYILINRKGFMDNLGVYSSKATKEEMKELIKEAERAGYQSLPDRFYNPGIADYPATITRVNLNGKIKRVFDGEPEAPQSLKKFEETLHNFFTQKERNWQLIRKKAGEED